MAEAASFSRKDGAMARKTNQHRANRPQDGTRPFSPGAHWRADGAPKATYASQQEALSMADERHQETGTRLNVYRCDYCSGWHMGTAEGRPR
jgi:hypothetical protein